MAALQKVERIDSEGLKDFKKSLICTNCKKPPRPGALIFTCASPENGIKCEIILFGRGSGDLLSFCCDRKKCQCGYIPRCDPILTKFVSLFKFYNCAYLKNGCQEELEAKDLEAHERICLFRDVICPKLSCDAKLVFNGIMEHYQEKHSDLKKKDDVLDFKGSLEDLEKNTFVLNCYGKPFYPQFYVNDGILMHYWVVGQGDQAEINPFEVNQNQTQVIAYFLMLLFILGHSQILD